MTFGEWRRRAAAAFTSEDAEGKAAAAAVACGWESEESAVDGGVSSRRVRSRTTRRARWARYTAGTRASRRPRAPQEPPRDASSQAPTRCGPTPSARAGIAPIAWRGA